MVTCNFSQFKLFDIHVYSETQTTNLQQNCTKQTLAPHFTGESLHCSVYCFIWSYVSVYLLYSEHVLCWWKAHFPLGRVKILEASTPNTPLPVLEHMHYSTGARQLQQHESGDGEKQGERVKMGELQWEGEKGEVSEVLFLSFSSRVSAWMEAKKQKRIVLKGVCTQIIS